MDVISELLRRPDWSTSLLAYALEHPHSVDDASLLRAVGTRIRDALRNGRAGVSLCWSFAGLVLSRRRTHLIADGLRPTPLASGPLQKLSWLHSQLAPMLEDAQLLSHLGRLRSWRAFSELVRHSRSLLEHFEARVARSPLATIQRALALVEEDFHRAAPPRRPTLAPSAFEDLDNEQAASAASFLVATAARTRGLSRAVRERSPPSPGECRDLLFEAWWLQELLEHEILVFRMGFLCHQDGPTEFRLEAPTDSVGYALSYGYVQAKHLPPLRVRRRVREGTQLQDLVQEFSAATSHARPYVVQRGSARTHIGYRIHEGHARAIAAIVNRHNAYHDEEVELRVAAQQLRLAPGALLALELAPGVPIRDVLRLQRLLLFLSISRSEELGRAELSADELREARLLFMRRDSFINLTHALGIERSQADSLVTQFAWAPSDGRPLDLQHTPIVAFDDHVLVPLSIAAGSNLIRNGLATSHVRPHADGKEDPLVADLLRAFEIGGHAAWAGVKYQWEGKTYEIDIVALVGQRLVVFEAKNTLLPCSSYELRTTWDHIEKAGDQLDRHLTALCDSAVRGRLSARLGVDLTGRLTSTCIVLSHYLFSGATIRHAVRQCDVVCSFVASGDGYAWLGKLRIPIRYRPLGKLNEDDLVSFLSDSSPVYSAAWAAGAKRERPVAVGKATLKVAEYTFVPAVQLCRSGLCSGEVQRRLEDATTRLERLDGAPEAEVEAAWADAESAYSAALDWLEKQGSPGRDPVSGGAPTPADSAAAPSTGARPTS